MPPLLGEKQENVYVYSFTLCSSVAKIIRKLVSPRKKEGTRPVFFTSAQGDINVHRADDAFTLVSRRSSCIESHLIPTSSCRYNLHLLG